MKTQYRLSILFGVCVLLSACSPRSETPGHSFRVFEENDVTIAETTGGPKYADELFSYSHLTFVHQDDSLEESLLGSVGYCFIGPEEQIFIGDRRNLRIAVFDRDGEFVREIGQRGNGPGEFRRIILLGIVNGLVVVADGTLRRTSLFHPDGRFIRTFPFPRADPASAMGYSAYSAYPGPDDLIIAGEQTFVPEEDGMRTLGRIAVYAADGTMMKEIVRESVVDPDPFQGMPLIRYQPSTGIYRTNGVDPLIHHFDHDGGLVKIIRLGLDPVPVTADDRSRTIEHAEFQIANARGDELRRLRQEQRDSFEFPQMKEFCSDMMIEETGYIWASEPPGVWDMPPWTRRYHIIGPQGDYLGLTTPPEVNSATAKIMVSRGILIYSYIDSESGAPVVELFRITPAVSRLRYP